MTENTFEVRPVKIRPFTSSVDIIIPYHGAYNHVTRLINSLIQYTTTNPFKITVVDDYSPNKNFVNQISESSIVNAIRTPKRLGFGGALKYGFDHTQENGNNYVVFMNSDCEVKNTNWLYELGLSLISLREENVKMVAPRTNNPGSTVDQRLKDKNDITRKDVVLQEGHLPFYCVMAHRELFKNIGGFIKSYPIGFYEDEELAARMRSKGYLQGISGGSWIYHEGQVTIKNCSKEEIEIIKSNRDKCIQDIRSH